MFGGDDLPLALVIDGSPAGLVDIKKVLLGHFDVTLALNAEAAIASAERRRPDVVVINVADENSRALDVFDDFVQGGVSAAVPVVFLADKNSARFEFDALDRGASDFIIRRENDENIVVLRLKKRISENAPTEKPPAQSPEEFLKGKKILIAEDVILNQSIIADILEDLDLEIDFADDGKIAVELFSRNPEKYCAVFMDIFMPVMDGYEASAKIRASGAVNAKTIPIIAMTADERGEEKCRESGMNGYITKPVGYDVIVSALVKHCGK